jgi:hypothetical protein
MTLKETKLTDRAMLVNLSISQWNAVKNDKRVNREVAQKHGSDESMGRYNKSLVAKHALDKVKKLANQARVSHYFRTLPWRDGGDRILSSAGYFAYAKEMRTLMSEFDSAVSEFCANYSQYVDDARKSLNGLFDADDYPKVAEIRSKFGMNFDVFPMPTSDDFRVNLGDSETARIKAEIESQSQAQLSRAMSDVWERMRDVVSKMSERLKAYTQTNDGKTSSPFRDSLVSNIAELLDILPTLNLTNDSRIDEFAREMRSSLTAFTPDQLRESETARKDTAMRADEILSKMAAFVA